MVDFKKLIPELAEWNNGDEIDIENWIDCIGNFKHAIAYSTIFWPDFIEFEDCVFKAQHFNEANVLNWLKHTSGDKQATEKVVNHLHLDDLFPNAEDTTDEQEEYLANIIKEMWEMKLERDFPNRNFEVILINDEFELQITFYQPR